MSRKFLRGLCFGLAVLALGMVSTAAQAEENIIDTAQSAGNFTTFLKAVETAGLTETLEGDGPFTVFAPTDAAFAKLPKGRLDNWLANPQKLKAILLFHVAARRIAAADVGKQTTITTLAGKQVPVRKTQDGVMIGRAHVTKTDIPCSNGTIHAIDVVLMPD